MEENIMINMNTTLYVSFPLVRTSFYEKFHFTEVNGEVFWFLMSLWQLTVIQSKIMSIWVSFIYSIPQLCLQFTLCLQAIDFLMYFHFSYSAISQVQDLTKYRQMLMCLVHLVMDWDLINLLTQVKERKKEWEDKPIWSTEPEMGKPVH